MRGTRCGGTCKRQRAAVSLCYMFPKSMDARKAQGLNRRPAGVAAGYGRWQRKLKGLLSTHKNPCRLCIELIDTPCECCAGV
jgi:hypothetical protein